MGIFYFIGLIATILFANMEIGLAGDPEITLFLKKIEVIPDYVVEDCVDFLKVTFDSGVSANSGKELTPTQVKNPPDVDWDSQGNFFYTLIMIHSDEPPISINTTEFKPRQFHHWLVANIPGIDIYSGDIIIEYLSSGPSKGSGLHLYVYLLYKQPKKLEFDEKIINKYSIDGRNNFSVMEFATKYDLGFPIAANYYHAQYDDYVPTVHAQIGH